MLFWIFLVRCSSRSIVINLIVSKEIQKYDQKKFYFFSIFFRTPKLPNKKIRNFANIKYKGNSRKYCAKKNFRQKNSIIKIFTKKKFVENNFRKKKIFEKKIFFSNVVTFSIFDEEFG